MRYFFALTACLSVALIAIPGCGNSEPKPVAVTAAPTDEPTAKAVQVDDAGPADVTPSATRKEPPKRKTPEEPFEPPFGHRVDLFSPPQRTQKAIQKNNDTGETVALQGFVNVNEPRVVLSVDGIVVPIAEGEEKYGIQVITIQPPKVVLQRGRERWTATLEN